MPFIAVTGCLCVAECRLLAVTGLTSWFAVYSSGAHSSCIIFSAASKAVFEGMLLLAVECLGFLLAKWSMQSFLLPPVTAPGMWLAVGLSAVLGKANPLPEDALLDAEQVA